MSEKSPKIAIQIVTYNAPGELETCLDSLSWVSSRSDVSVFIYDNNSRDSKTRDILRSTSFKVTLGDQNQGFSRSHNFLCDITTKDHHYIMILNPDTTLSEESFNKLLTFLIKNSEYSCVAPQILNGDEIELSCFREVTPLMFCQDIIRSTLGMGEHLVYTPASEMEVFGVSGAAVLYRVNAISKLQLFDPNFFMYLEDYDQALRFNNHELKYYYLPEAQVTHTKNASTSGEPTIRGKMMRIQSLNYLVSKHYPGIKAKIVKTFLIAAVFLSLRHGSKYRAEVIENIKLLVRR